MTAVLLALLRLIGLTLLVWTLGMLIASAWSNVERRLRARARSHSLPLQPCARLFSARIPCRDPEVTGFGGWMLACSQWSPLPASCKAIGSGSPND